MSLNYNYKMIKISDNLCCVRLFFLFYYDMIRAFLTKKTIGYNICSSNKDVEYPLDYADRCSGANIKVVNVC